MPRNTREANKRSLKAALNLCDNIDAHLMNIYGTFPDEQRYAAYRDSLLMFGQVLHEFKTLLENFDENY